MSAVTKQAGYSIRQAFAPDQRTSKHLLQQDTFFIVGKIKGARRIKDSPMAVVALSDKFRTAEVVDVNHTSRPDSYYGLNLPHGEYRLVVVRDRDRNGYYDESEIVGGRKLSISETTGSNKVLGDFDIDLRHHRVISDGTFRIAVQADTGRKESLFYPKGSLRTLDDPLFSRHMAEIGAYHPAAFLEEAPMMFYALEEDIFYKIPVVFVHGIGGSARDFETMVASLDRTRFKPWFFYYPSGLGLTQSGEMFYRIFLSGTVIPLGEMPLIVVAHSMGGLVVREAFNNYRGQKSENRVARLITIASPFGGHPGAQSGINNAPMILPAWRDLSPESEFVAQLHRQPLPTDIDYHLFFAYGNDSAIKLGENSDGVVPLSSQLNSAAQREASEKYGYDDSHRGILKNSEAIHKIMAIIDKVDFGMPEAMLNIANKGGFRFELGPDYTPLETYYIHNFGYLLQALASGRIKPHYPEQKHFVRVAQGKARAKTAHETAWIKFIRDCRAKQLLTQCPATR